jgi:hypothetical protein
MLDACACRGFGLIELRREEDGGYHVHSSNPRTGQTPATMSGFNPLPPTYFASNWGIDDELAFVLVEAWPEELVEALELDEAGDLRQFCGRLQVEGLEYGSGPRRLAWVGGCFMAANLDLDFAPGEPRSIGVSHVLAACRTVGRRVLGRLLTRL